MSQDLAGWIDPVGGLDKPLAGTSRMNKEKVSYEAALHGLVTSHTSNQMKMHCMQLQKDAPNHPRNSQRVTAANEKHIEQSCAKRRHPVVSLAHVEAAVSVGAVPLMSGSTARMFYFKAPSGGIKHNSSCCPFAHTKPAQSLP